MTFFQRGGHTFWGIVVTILLAQCASRPSGDVYFNEVVEDKYQWMENETDPRLRPWVAAQDKAAREHLNKIPFREALKKRFKELYSKEWRSLPKERAGTLFYLTQDAEQEKAVLVRYHNKKETILIDPSSWRAGDSAQLGEWIPSLDGKYVAYSVVPEGNENKAYIEVLDVEKPTADPTDHIEGTKHAAPGWLNQPIWHPDSHGFFYNFVPQSQDIPEAKRQGFSVVKFHKLGTDQNQDEVIYPSTGDPSILVDFDISVDGKWFFLIKRRVPVSDTILVARADQRPLQFQTVFDKNVRASVDAYRNTFVNFTDWEAPNKRVLKATYNGDAKTLQWRTLVPERKDVVIEWGGLVGNKVLLQVQKDVLTELEVYELSGKRLKSLALPAKGTVENLSYDPIARAIFFEFQSMLYPETHFRVANPTAKPVLVWKSKPPVDTSKFQMEQRFFTATDGTKIPIFVVTSKTRKKDEPIPFLIYGYAAWKNSQLPIFNENIFPWLEAGGGFALINARGGGEYGQRWHEQGSRLNKLTSIQDMISGAEFLIGEKFTAPDKLAIRGGSFGGLLVSAMLTQRPDLFRAVLCEVPLTDMLRYHLSGIGPNWVEEFGTSANEQDYRALRSYSPYHHVDPQKSYPATLILSADNDERVKPSHARKFFARLSEAPSKGPILLRTEGAAGHDGANHASSRIEAQADKYSFLMEQTGLTPRITKP